MWLFFPLEQKQSYAVKLFLLNKVRLGYEQTVKPWDTNEKEHAL